MSNVVALPSGPVREWLGVEKVLRDILAEKAHEQDVIDYVCSTLRPVYLKWDNESHLKIAGHVNPEQLQQITDWFTTMFGGMMLELANREIELYHLRGQK